MPEQDFGNDKAEIAWMIGPIIIVLWRKMHKAERLTAAKEDRERKETVQRVEGRHAEESAPVDPELNGGKS